MDPELLGSFYVWIKQKSGHDLKGCAHVLNWSRTYKKANFGISTMERTILNCFGATFGEIPEDDYFVLKNEASVTMSVDLRKR